MDSDPEFENNEEEMEVERKPIPEVLHSFYEERPFKICTRCGESLADFEDGFRVSKHFKAGETIIEYALCFPCLHQMIEESSEESKERLMEFQMSRFRNVSGFDECNLCEKTQETARDHEFGLVGICQGSDMLDSGMVCVDCIEEMSELVSEETRGGWDRFKEENFPGIPADFAPGPVPGPVKKTPVMI